MKMWVDYLELEESSVNLIKIIQKEKNKKYTLRKIENLSKELDECLEVLYVKSKERDEAKLNVEALLDMIKKLKEKVGHYD